MKNLEEDVSKPYVYDEFDALPLKQNEGKSILEFDTLDAALDEFYAKVSLQSHSIAFWYILTCVYGPHLGTLFADIELTAMLSIL